MPGSGAGTGDLEARATRQQPRRGHSLGLLRPGLALRDPTGLPRLPGSPSSSHLLSGSRGYFHAEVTDSDRFLSSLHLSPHATRVTRIHQAASSTPPAPGAHIPRGALPAVARPREAAHRWPWNLRQAPYELMDIKWGFLPSKGKCTRPAQGCIPASPSPPSLSDRKQLEQDPGVSCCQKNS